MSINKKAIILIVVLCAGISSVAISLLLIKASQTPEAQLSISPSRIIYETLIKGQRFSINISIANVTDLKGYEFKLSFNTAMLDVVGVAALPEENLPLGNWKVNDAAAVVWMNFTYDGSPITTENPVALARITFKIMDYGESILHLYDITLVNSSGNLILHNTSDGLILVRLHEIAVIDVTPSTNETYIGRKVNVTVIIKNYGDAMENFTVKVYHNETLFGTSAVINLASDGNITLTFSWNTSDVIAGYSYLLKAEASIVPFEANTTNNVMVDGEVKIKIIGDVDNNNMVEINDLVLWDAAYGSSANDPHWNSQADINGDGVVDKEDGILIIQNYKSL